MSYQGYIYLHRKMLDSAIWTSDERYDKRSAWVELMLLANHADNNVYIDGNEVVIKRGQYLTSKRKLALKWRWDVKTVTRYLNALEKAKMIFVDSTKRYTLITILKYAEYQDVKAFSGKKNPTQNPTVYGEQCPQYVHTDALQTMNVINDNECLMNENKIIPAPPHGGGEWQ